MKELVDRSIYVLKQQGFRGFVKSASAHVYNQGLFRFLIGGRAAYYRRRGHVGYQNPYQPLWIDPTDITHSYQGCFNQKIRLGQIKNGMWDEERSDIIESPTYRGLKQRFHEGYAWEDTAYYQHAVNRLENGETVMGYRSIQDFKSRLEYIDNLYNNISDNGYRSQQDLSDDDWDPKRHPVVTPAHEQVGEVGINIGRDGIIMQNDGIHRLVIAKLVDIEKIPVQVIVRHRKWQKIRDSIVKPDSFPCLESKYSEHPDIEAVLK